MTGQAQRGWHIDRAIRMDALIVIGTLVVSMVLAYADIKEGQRTNARDHAAFAREQARTVELLSALEGRVSEQEKWRKWMDGYDAGARGRGGAGGR